MKRDRHCCISWEQEDEPTGRIFEFRITGTAVAAERRTHDYPGCPAHIEDLDARLQAVCDSDGNHTALLEPGRTAIEKAFNTLIETDPALRERIEAALMEDANTQLDGN